MNPERRLWYDTGRRPNRPRATAAFFGDQISPRSVFLIDVSGSMKQIVTLRPTRSSKTAVAGAEDRGEMLFGKSSPKIEIVKKELERAIGALQPVCEFNVLKYSERALAWRMVKGKPRWYPPPSNTKACTQGVDTSVPSAVTL